MMATMNPWHTIPVMRNGGNFSNDSMEAHCIRLGLIARQDVDRARSPMAGSAGGWCPVVCQVQAGAGQDARLGYEMLQAQCNSLDRPTMILRPKIF